MQSIDNRATLLLDQLKGDIKPNSKVYLACDHFTAFALFELVDTLKKAASVQVLLNSKFEAEPFQLIQATWEAPLNLELDRRYRVQQVLGLLEDKFEIRRGSTSNQNILIVQTEKVVKTFLLTPSNLDSVALGTLGSATPTLINVFDQGTYLLLALC